MRWIKIVVSILIFGGLIGGLGYVFARKSYYGFERLVRISRVGDGISVETFDPKTQLGVRIDLPDELLIDTVEGKGEWKISAVAKLAEKNGQKWLAASVANALGTFYQDHTLAAWNFLTRDVKWSELDLVESGYVDELKLVDGVRVWKLNGAWEKKAAEVFVSLELASEQIDVEVVNTTGLLGLANQAAYAIANSGIRVLMLSAQESMVTQRCVVVGSRSELKSKTALYIKKQMGCTTQEDTEDDLRIKVLVGKKYEEWWKGSN